VILFQPFLAISQMPMFVFGTVPSATTLKPNRSENGKLSPFVVSKQHAIYSLSKRSSIGLNAIGQLTNKGLAR
jgi:hypothetical protein